VNDAAETRAIAVILATALSASIGLKLLALLLLRPGPGFLYGAF
jgi:hypothetical protein